MKRRVTLGDGVSVTAIVYPARGPCLGTLVLAHGAGADQEHAFMVDTARRLARAGVRTITFNFPYTEAGRRAPDPPAVLQRCFRAVIADEGRRRARARREPIFIGGKSMGGRMASHLVAEGDPGIAGLVCLGYPLHPSGRPDKLRTSHLSAIRVPMLVVQGTRDAFGGPDEIRAHTRSIPSVTVLPVEEGDHSFKVPKRVATAETVMGGIVQEIVRWMRAVPTGQA